jgi:Polyketide cyclase / dehydrase and lipid transport
VKLPSPRLLAAAAFLIVFPFFLRRRPRVERRITILAAPETIFPFLNDLQNWPLWTSWSRREEIHYTYGDIREGPGAEQSWSNQRMHGVMRILKTEPDERIDYELTLQKGKYRMLGRVELHADGECTRVVWKCVWDLAKNPYHRYFDLLLRWMIGSDFAEGLANLKAVVENSHPRPLVLR